MLMNDHTSASRHSKMGQTRMNAGQDKELGSKRYGGITNTVLRLVEGGGWGGGTWRVVPWGSVRRVPMMKARQGLSLCKRCISDFMLDPAIVA